MSRTNKNRSAMPSGSSNSSRKKELPFDTGSQAEVYEEIPLALTDEIDEYGELPLFWGNDNSPYEFAFEDDKPEEVSDAIQSDEREYVLADNAEEDFESAVEAAPALPIEKAARPPKEKAFVPPLEEKGGGETEEAINTRYDRRHDIRRRELLIIIAVFSVLMGGWLWRSFVYSRTPEYALRQIAAALNEHDVEKFNRYVKLDALTLVAYDDLTADLFQYNQPLEAKSHARYLDFYQRIKPQLAHGTAETIRRYIKSGVWPDEYSGLLKGRQLGIDYEHFMERSQLRNTALIAIEGIQPKGAEKPDEAVGKIKILDRYTGTPYILEVTIERQSDGHWCIIAVENYRGYLNAVAKGQNEELTAYIATTQPIIDEYNLRFIGQRSRFRAITKRSRPLTKRQIAEIKAIIENETIPDLKSRQEKLNAFDIEDGSRYLSSLRRRSTEFTIAAWQHFIEGLEKNDPDELNLAETIHKQVLETDLRIEDIVNHSTVSQPMPEVQ